MESNEEVQQSSGEQSSETESKTESTTKQSLLGLSKPQLVKLLKPRMKKWAVLIVDTAISQTPPDAEPLSRQKLRDLYRKQYKHMRRMMTGLNSQALVSLHDETNWLDDVNESRLILPGGVESSEPSTQPQQSSKEETND